MNNAMDLKEWDIDENKIIKEHTFESDEALSAKFDSIKEKRALFCDNKLSEEEREAFIDECIDAKTIAGINKADPELRKKVAYNIIYNDVFNQKTDIEIKNFKKWNRAFFAALPIIYIKTKQLHQEGKMKIGFESSIGFPGTLNICTYSIRDTLRVCEIDEKTNVLKLTGEYITYREYLQELDNESNKNSNEYSEEKLLAILQHFSPTKINKKNMSEAIIQYLTREESLASTFERKNYDYEKWDTRNTLNFIFEEYKDPESIETVQLIKKIYFCEYNSIDDEDIKDLVDLIQEKVKESASDNMRENITRELAVSIYCFWINAGMAFLNDYSMLYQKYIEEERKSTFVIKDNHFFCPSCTAEIFYGMDSCPYCGKYLRISVK